MLSTLVVFGLFFVSGLAALIYQVVWQRLLVLFSGADVHSATIVVAAFMAGLGCGSFVGGVVADRVGASKSILGFALAELAIAAFGASSGFLFYDMLYGQLAASNPGMLFTALTLFVVLLWPTFFMGASLPLLARGLTRDSDGAAPTVGWLYALNTAGAATGAFVATWLLLPQAGLTGSLGTAATLNLLCAVVALPLALARRGSGLELEAAVGTTVFDQPGESIDGGRVGFWAVLFGLSGFVGLSLEIVWFRLLGVMLKSTAFTFGTLLAVYLLGLAIGSAAGSIISRRWRRPGLGFLALQTVAGAYAAISVMLLIRGLDGQFLPYLRSYFGQYDGVDVRSALEFWGGLRADAGSAPSDMLRLYLVVPALLVGPPTVLAGMSFPLLQRVVQTDLTRLGRRVGLLLSANVAGSTLGAFVTGLVLLDRLGTPRTLVLLACISGTFGLLALLRHGRSGRIVRVASLAVGAAMLAALAAAMPDTRELWSSLHGAKPNTTIQSEGASGVSVLRGERPDFRRTVVFVNGLGQSWLPYGGIHTQLGALPAFIHERPHRAALIGLGSGDTLFGLAGRRELTDITSIEIIEPQLRTLRELARWNGYPGLASVLSDPRIRHITGDGRRFLAGSRERYDIIQADALRPQSAYAGHLYSDAYFSLLRSRLAPHGLAVSWAPTERALQTFVSVFPYVAQHGEVAIGSDSPITIDAATLEQRLRDPQVASYFAAGGVDIVELLVPYLNGWKMFGPSDARGSAGINTDLHPRDEFDVAPLVRLPFF